MKDRDYQRLLLDGFFNHRDFLTNHIEREAIKGKDKHIPSEEFFARCYSIIRFWEQELDKQLHERKRELYQIIEITNSQESREVCNEELKTISRRNYSVHLSSVTNNDFMGPLWYEGVLEIKGAIDKAAGSKDLTKVDLHNEEQKAAEKVNLTLEIIANLDFEKACSIICEGLSIRMPDILKEIKNLEGLSANDKKEFESYEGLTKQEIFKKEKSKIISQKDKIINAYTTHFKKVDEKAVDPEFTKKEFKTTVYNTIIEHKDHFKTFRQFPSDWNNVELFGRLWGEAVLIRTWSKQDEPTTSSSYKISNLLRPNMQIENPFLKNDSWTKEGKQSGTDFIRMIVDNISKLKIEGSPQNYQLIARAHDVQVSDKSIRNVMKEGMKVELKRNKSGA